MKDFIAKIAGMEDSSKSKGVAAASLSKCVICSIGVQKCPYAACTRNINISLRQKMEEKPCQKSKRRNRNVNIKRMDLVLMHK